jgi:hypothetical protein
VLTTSATRLWLAINAAAQQINVGLLGD